MKFKNNEFRLDAAQSVEAPLDFSTLCALLAAHQAETPTAKIARHEICPGEAAEHSNPAVAVLLEVAGRKTPAGRTAGSFHAAAAACFHEELG